MFIDSPRESGFMNNWNPAIKAQMLLLEPQSDVIEIGDFSKVETEIVATQLKWSPLPDLNWGHPGVC